MLKLKKKEIKLSLIEEYITIFLATNFFKNDFSFYNLDEVQQKNLQETKQLSLSLLFQYEHLLTKLKLNDLSLLILKKDLINNNLLFQKSSCENSTLIIYTLKYLNTKLINISSSLKEKQKALKIKPFV